MVARRVKKGATLGANKVYDTLEFVEALREVGVTPHIAQKLNSALDKRTTRHLGYAISLEKRKRVEEIFGWAKTIGGLRKARFVGLVKVKAQTIFTLTAYSISKSFVMRRRAADRAIARQGEVSSVTEDLEME